MVILAQAIMVRAPLFPSASYAPVIGFSCAPIGTDVSGSGECSVVVVVVMFVVVMFVRGIVVRALLFSSASCMPVIGFSCAPIDMNVNG
ncbi:hypothetical protein AWN90_16355 [Nocardia terpenica]|uniref:Uncharacterized protein n=1 Tax=Nocardia terpenica TaxID=455432 RepID=A0A161WRC7_9NOCA|nr:hypothetical protein AWN90_16355 [Nocardia terpenica]